MVVDDVFDYRIPGMLTIANFEGFSSAEYLVIFPDYEDSIDEEPQQSLLNIDVDSEHFLYLDEIKMKYELDRVLKGSITYDYDLIKDIIYSYGGVNINPQSKGWKGFVKIR